MPYLVQKEAVFPAQIWLRVRKPSLITVFLMFAVVTGTGVWSSAGVILPGPFWTFPFVGGAWPLVNAIATFAAASASFLTPF